MNKEQIQEVFKENFSNCTVRTEDNFTGLILEDRGTKITYICLKDRAVHITSHCKAEYLSKIKVLSLLMGFECSVIYVPLHWFTAVEI